MSAGARGPAEFIFLLSYGIAPTAVREYLRGRSKSTLASEVPRRRPGRASVEIEPFHDDLPADHPLVAEGSSHGHTYAIDDLHSRRSADREMAHGV